LRALGFISWGTDFLQSICMNDIGGNGSSSVAGTAALTLQVMTAARS
jgi:hypothetical protein